MFPAPAFDGHELLDSGGGEKLERFGPVVLRRPDPAALWRPRLSAAAWNAAHLRFERDASSGGRHGTWRPSPGAPDEARGKEPSWPVHFEECVFLVRPTPFKHVGLFPEQAANWGWIAARAGQLGRPRPRLLNLFGYTGSASLVALRAGYEVTHVDASKTSLAWARENLAASGHAPDAMRVLLDDALAFLRREVRRGHRYEALVMDPPHFGRGPKGETWQLEEHLQDLIAAARELLAERSYLILSTYAAGVTPLGLEGLFADLSAGELQVGELALCERSDPAGPARRLPTGCCARWWRGFERERP